MVTPTTWLPQLYQRFQSFWDRAVPATGLALLLWASAQATGTYPSEWRLFLAALLFLSGLIFPRGAYVAFTFLIAYPLYGISIYLAAIVLAVLILTSHWAMQNLGAAVLVLITPALLPWHLETIVPLLAGLWWGELTGALAGGLAALWLKLLAGMAGQPLDLARLSGWTPAGTNIIERFNGFNSLQTLLGLVNPFADTSRSLMLHLLQILAWALAGYVAGRLARRVWSEHWRGWAPLLSTIPAGGVLWASYVFVPRLLDPSAQPSGLATELGDLTLWLLISALAAGAVRQFYLYLRRPLMRPLHRRHRREPATQRASRPPGLDKRRSKPVPPPEHEPSFNWTPSDRPQATAEADDDVIMLEMD